MKRVPTEIEVRDPFDPEPMKGPLSFWPSAGVDVLVERVNEIVDWINRQEEKWEDGK